MKELIQCIEESQTKGLELINNYSQYLQVSKQFKTMENIIIVGSGSSYNSGLLAQSFIEQQLNINVNLYYPNDFLKYTNHSLIRGDTLIVFITQGGQTKLVVESAQKMKEQKISSIAITENATSKISELTDVTLDTNTGIEAYMYRTIGVTNTSLSLILFTMALKECEGVLSREKREIYCEDLASVFSKFNEIIEFSKQWYLKHHQQLDDAESLIFSASGQYWPVAKEADIKFMEMLPLLTSSFELEELIHGPQNMFKRSHVFFLIADEHIDLQKALDIQRFIQEDVKAKVYLISEEAYNEFKCESHFKFFLYLVFFQVLAYETAKTKGRDFSEGIYPKVSEYVKKSIEKEGEL